MTQKKIVNLADRQVLTRGGNTRDFYFFVWVNLRYHILSYGKITQSVKNANAYLRLFNKVFL